MLAPMEFRELTPDRWPGLEALFGEKGACAQCWCMWWRVKRSEFEKGRREKGASNRRAFRELVESGVVPGLLAYDGGEPVGWVAIEPRKAYPVMGRSPVVKPVDDQPAWSVSCFFMRADRQRTGMSGKLLTAAVDHARRSGATIIEGYPVDPMGEEMPGAWAWTGLLSTFEKAGFDEVARRKDKRPFMRLRLD